MAQLGINYTIKYEGTPCVKIGLQHFQETCLSLRWHYYISAAHLAISDLKIESDIIENSELSEETGILCIGDG